jgi:iron complex outermembrane recepter protein
MMAERETGRRRSVVGVVAAMVAVLTHTVAGGGAAQQRVEERGASIWGTVVSAETGAPIAAAYVRVSELGRNELSHRDGSFHFDRLAAGSYTIAVQRLGYAPVEQVVRATAGDTVRVTVRLRESAIQIPGVVVTGAGRERSAQETYRPTTVLNGAELRRRLGTSVAATLADEPGIAQRFNGPAASQPVVRGLSGDRVLVLEDGLRTGDVATTGADHAVTIEPLTAERIEVVRGPAGLMYGSNALGGVINVVRDEVARTLPERVTGTVSVQGESVNRGATAGGSVLVPAGHLAIRGELSGRTAGDTRTPLGVLPSTELGGYNGAVGMSWIGDAGFVGASVRDYGLEYGVPGTFNGEAIPGAHPGGVRVDLHRTAARAQAGWRPRVGPFNSLEAEGNYVRFWQDEIEDGGLVGTRFGQLLGTGNLIARHGHEGEGIRVEGAFGLSFLARDFSAAGAFSGSHPANQYTIAGFVFEELGWAATRVQAGARYDLSRISPQQGPGGRAEGVRTREFGAVSGSFAALHDVHPGWTIGVSMARAFRTPSIEELYSDGPHLADYSFNIGNPELRSEVGHGLDAFVRVAVPRVHLDVTAFRNQISDYIFYAPTGQLDPRFQRFPVYQATQGNSVLTGGEAKLQWEALRSVVVEGNAGYVRGTLREADSPLPSIPPLHAGLGVRYDSPLFFAGLAWDGTSAQNRVGEFETRTAAHGMWNGTGGVRWTMNGQLHSVTLQLRNLGDAVWYDHLSRVKDVAPQPGRNLQLLYRVSF